MKHGLSRSKTYRSWAGAKSRCTNKENPSYHHYGGRGISMCQRWQDSFENFLEDMGECPPHEWWGLDRINNNGNYEPGNCRWASPLQQSNNRRTRYNHRRVWFSIGMNVSLKAEIVAIAKSNGTSIHRFIEEACEAEAARVKRRCAEDSSRK